MAGIRHLIGAALLALCLGCPAVTLRVANAGDVQTMDPHSVHETLTLAFLANVYEPLVGRGKDMSLVPALATRWTLIEPTVWRFQLRRGVRFHDGTAFDAEDVLFSFRRAAGESSDLKGQMSPIKEVRKVDDHTVDVETRVPFPILPDSLTVVYMMSRKWCEEHNALQPIDRKKALEHPAVLEANGTGPFRLKERQPGVRTVLARHAGYWEAVESNVDEVVYTPIANDASRVAALLTGGVDVIEPVPLQAVDRLAAHPDVKLLQGPELRTVFLGLDQQRDELLYASVKGRNPFRDRRVRQAMSLAIDVEAIHRNLMRGASTPTALMVAPGVRGFQPDMNRRPPPDPQAALRLLAEAGYADGFEVDLNCPNDRYVNDAAICQAVASYLARVNIRVRVRTETKSIYQPRLLKRDTSFYLLGWTPSTTDAHDVLFHIMCTPNERGQGQFNIGGYSNPRVDELAAKIQSETDPAARNGLIREAFRLHQEEVGHIPLHQQALIWGLARRVSLVQLPNDRMFFKWAVVQDERAQGR